MRNSRIQPRIGQKNITQMNFAKNGHITEEMSYVAKKENLPPSLITVSYTHLTLPTIYSV